MKKLTVIFESIYDLILGFWLPFLSLIMIACFSDINNNNDDGGNLFLLILIFIITLILLVPTNIIFYKNKKESKQILYKITPIIFIVLGVIIRTIFYRVFIFPFNHLYLFVFLILFITLFIKNYKISQKFYLISIIIIDILFMIYSVISIFFST